MSNLKDIKQNKQTKQKYQHPIIDLLLTDTPKTKQEIGDILHISTEREVRNVVAKCSMHYPIIAVSTSVGYRRAKDFTKLTDEELEKEIEAVNHQLNELKSRVTCLKKKMKPLVAWLKKAEEYKETE